MTAGAPVIPTAVLAGSRERVKADSSPYLLLFIVAHVPLALLFQGHPTISGIHALATLVVGIWGAIRWPLGRVAYFAAYIVGADVLWRMTSAPVPWEFAKYAVVLLVVVASFRAHGVNRSRMLPIFYFLLLLPSIVIVANDVLIPWSGLRTMLSFNLSGPLALCASAWFCSQIHLDQVDLERLLTALIAPVLAIATVTAVSTYRAVDLVFTDESNLVTSGGFGPNQVSAVLGLGALAALLLLLHGRGRLVTRLCVLTIAFALGVQSAMTFSRGGLFTVAGAVLLGSYYFLRDPHTRRILAAALPVVTFALFAAVLPRLYAVTGGALSERFRDLEPSHREEIAREDLRIWFEHPILGVGPGGARRLRQTESRIAHTEYSRLLSEHGMLGLLAIGTLLLMAVVYSQAQPNARGRGLSLAFSAWGLLAMVHLGMRVAAVAVVFGFAAIRFENVSSEVQEAPLEEQR